jgi:hypothetical protein
MYYLVTRPSLNNAAIVCNLNETWPYRCDPEEARCIPQKLHATSNEREENECDTIFVELL